MPKPKLESTKNYKLFRLSKINRNITEKPDLEKSMKKNGFLPSCAIHCKKNGNGTLEVVRGHHRLHYAKKLGLSVYYIIDGKCDNPWDLEGQPGQTWSLNDFATGRAKAGDKNCKAVLNFKKKHNMPIGVAASLVGGEGAGSNNKSKFIKRGTFKIGDMKHANQVARITDACRELGVEFATRSAFVSAISLALKVPELDIDTLLYKINTYGALMGRRSRVSEYLEELENVYNHGSKRKRIPLKFRAEEESRKRQATFSS